MKINILKNNFKIWTVAGAVVLSLFSIELINWGSTWVM